MERIEGVNRTIDEELDWSIHQLEEMVNIIKENRPLPPPSPEIEALLTQALERRKEPLNEEWARQLANDVGSLTD